MTVEVTGRGCDLAAGRPDVERLSRSSEAEATQQRQLASSATDGQLWLALARQRWLGGQLTKGDMQSLSLTRRRIKTLQAFGRAYGTGHSHARSPLLQHRPSACWGRCPQTPFLNSKSIFLVCTGIYM